MEGICMSTSLLYRRFGVPGYRYASQILEPGSTELKVPTWNGRKKAGRSETIWLRFAELARISCWAIAQWWSVYHRLNANAHDCVLTVAWICVAIRDQCTSS